MIDIRKKYDSLYNVMTKEVLINLRVRSEVRDDFKIVAELRGSSISGLLHQYMIKLIREEKDREPKMFEKSVENSLMYADDKGSLDDDTAEFKQKKVA
jgi:hypothetical protein